MEQRINGAEDCACTSVAMPAGDPPLPTSGSGRPQRKRRAPNRLEPGDHAATATKRKAPVQARRKAGVVTALEAMLASERAASAVVRRHLTDARRDNDEQQRELREANNRFAALKAQVQELAKLNAQMRATAESKERAYTSALPAAVEVTSTRYMQFGIPIRSQLPVMGVCCAHPADPTQTLMIFRSDAVPAHAALSKNSRF